MPTNERRDSNALYQAEQLSGDDTTERALLRAQALALIDIAKTLRRMENLPTGSDVEG